ncbi:Endoribonuclease L-PSP/chorismate mutase-like protein [Aspergillus pseudocaelatus]|uniref:Endoribonuclease L-PSP/chorismate mutase-like protein n=1 Tax=Aspergillus pseudocaelatus TaxID=1825620 RepID=A0ABQ6WNW1_9EURO|nr:Endoribonuclease L-PSP/chorismate mutase-like protein [Aspergillus pseudocaelatus]
MSTSGVVSPFRISRKDGEKLDRNEAFIAVREHLKRQEMGMDAPSFCSHHRHSCSDQDKESFRLHRDIIHTLLLPLFLLHHQASRVAARALPSRKEAESERAFRGEARSAYAWLQCILTEEHDWYLTERCPACIVLHVLHSEPTIRFVAVACLLSDHLQGLDLLHGKNRLPSFDFWLEALETAVREDPFWGHDFWPDIEYRACALTDGVKQLVLQCLELRSALDRQSQQSQTYDSSAHFRQEQKLLSKVAGSRCMSSYWQDRPQRFHARRHGDPRRRSCLWRYDNVRNVLSPTGRTSSVYATSSPFEEKIGYYRAVRHGRHIFVSGTTAVDPASPSDAPQILFPGDARQQTRVALQECIRAVQALGGKGAENVVRVRMFVSQHKDCVAVGEGYTEVLGRASHPGVGAAATMVVVNGFVDERMLVEVEVDAILED